MAKKAISKTSTAVEPANAKAKAIASDDLPRKTLEEAIRVARVIKDDYAGKFAT